MVRAALAGAARRAPTYDGSGVRARGADRGAGRAGRGARSPRNTWADRRRTTRRRAKLAGDVPRRTSRSSERRCGGDRGAGPRAESDGRDGDRDRAADSTSPLVPPTFESSAIPLWNNIRARRASRSRAARYAGGPAAALRPPARPRLPRLSRRDPHPLRARARRLPPRPARRSRALDERGELDAASPSETPARRAPRGAAARHRALPLLARARGDRRPAPRGGRARRSSTEGELGERARAIACGQDAPDARRARSSAGRARARCRDSSPARSTSTRSTTSSATPGCAACPTARSTWTGCSTRSRCVADPASGRRGDRRAREGR